MIESHLGPSGNRPFTIVSPHIYVVCRLPFLDCNNPLCGLVITEDDKGLVVSGCLKAWQQSIIAGCSIDCTDYDREVFNKLHQEFSDLGLEFKARKITQLTGFTLQ
jgi:hypothetical protein